MDYEEVWDQELGHNIVRILDFSTFEEVFGLSRSKEFGRVFISNGTILRDSYGRPLTTNKFNNKCFIEFNVVFEDLEQSYQQVTNFLLKKRGK